MLVVIRNRPTHLRNNVDWSDAVVARKVEPRWHGFLGIYGHSFRSLAFKLSKELEVVVNVNIVA